MRPAGVVGRIRTYLVADVLVVAPVAVTLLLTWGRIRFLDERIIALVPAHLRPEAVLSVSIPGLGILLMVVGLIAAGVAAVSYLGRLPVRLAERVLVRLPVLESIHGPTKTVVETVLTKRPDVFRGVVLFEYPDRGQ